MSIFMQVKLLKIRTFDIFGKRKIAFEQKPGDFFYR